MVYQRKSRTPEDRGHPLFFPTIFLPRSRIPTIFSRYFPDCFGKSESGCPELLPGKSESGCPRKVAVAGKWVSRTVRKVGVPNCSSRFARKVGVPNCSAESGCPELFAGVPNCSRELFANCSPNSHYPPTAPDVSLVVANLSSRVSWSTHCWASQAHPNKPIGFRFFVRFCKLARSETHQSRKIISPQCEQLPIATAQNIFLRADYLILRFL